MTKHFDKVEADIAKVIPDVDFRGIAVIDWEFWRPVFDRNWDKLSIYRCGFCLFIFITVVNCMILSECKRDHQVHIALSDWNPIFSISHRKMSMAIVKQRHPSWPDSLVEEIARLEFETAAQQFMEGTILLAEKLRPKSLWGFYGFPNCYNNKEAGNCSELTMEYNDQISWMFESSSALFPSIYLHDMKKLNNTSFVKYRLMESFRHCKKSNGLVIPVYPYVRITYAVSQIYLNVVS